MNGNKSKYVLDYKDLQLYFSLGLNLVVVYRILKFKQSDWLQNYIDFNMGRRKKFVDSFGRDFLKLINNSNCGKTIENLRERMNVRLVNNARDYKNM